MAKMALYTSPSDGIFVNNTYYGYSVDFPVVHVLEALFSYWLEIQSPNVWSKAISTLLVMPALGISLQ